MNEYIFFLQVLVVTSCTLGALTLGKEALVASICLQQILANLFITKQITLFGMDVVSTDVFAVGSILGLNLLQEYFGLEQAKKTIIISFAALIFYMAMTQFLLWYTPNGFDIMHHHFDQVLGYSLRIVSASVGVYILSQYASTYIYAQIKELWPASTLFTRNMLSLCLSQLLDTVLFTILALYGIVANVFHIIVISYSIKMIVIALSSTFIGLWKQICKTPTQ